MTSLSKGVQASNKNHGHLDWCHECHLYSNCPLSRLVHFLGGLLMAIDNCLAFHASTFYSIKSITLQREEKCFMIYMSVYILFP